MPTTDLIVPARRPFDFRLTAYSHGWALLRPFTWDDEQGFLTYTLHLRPGRVVHLAMGAAPTAGPPGVRTRIRHTGRLTGDELAAVEDAVARMFRTDEDLSEFAALCRSCGPPWDQLPPGAGRLLRSPTLFEDVVKTICTTNIQWSGTQSMVQSLVARFGEPSGPGGARAFPTAEALASAKQADLIEARLGYRAPYVQTIAQEVTNGARDLAALEDPGLPTEDLRKRLLDIKGVGQYAAHTLLMLLGRYEHLAFDTVLRDFVSRKYFNGENPSLAQIEEIYAGWGSWKYLAYWFDLWSEG